MDIRERHFGSISSASAEGAIAVDVGALVRRLLLFEHCTLESNLLREMPDLVRTFGINGMTTLLESGALSVICEALTAGQVGQLAELRMAEERGGPLPLGSYHLSSIGIPLEEEHRSKYISEALTAFQSVPGAIKKKIKLKQLLIPMLETYPLVAGNDGVADARRDIINEHSTIWNAIRREAMTGRGLDLGEVPRLSVVDLGSDDFAIETPLEAQLGPADAHKLVERAILGVAGTNIRIDNMKQLESVTGFRDDEFPFFDDKIGFLMREIDPSVQEDRLDRIVEIAGLPTLSPVPDGSTLDINKILKMRDSEECRELRTWLRNVDSETDAEINARFDDLRGRMAEVVESPTRPRGSFRRDHRSRLCTSRWCSTWSCRERGRFVSRRESDRPTGSGYLLVSLLPIHLFLRSRIDLATEPSCWSDCPRPNQALLG